MINLPDINIKGQTNPGYEKENAGDTNKMVLLMAARMEAMQTQIDELRNEKGLPSGAIPGRSTPADLDVIKSNQAHLVKLVTTLQTHVGEEHVHRVNGQQELREICSAEISARRKAAAKTSLAIEKINQHTEDGASQTER